MRRVGSAQDRDDQIRNADRDHSATGAEQQDTLKSSHRPFPRQPQDHPCFERATRAPIDLAQIMDRSGLPLRSHRYTFRIELLLEDVPLVGLGHEERPDHDGHQRDHDRIPETEVDVAGLRHHGERGGGQQAAEPAVADVIGQRQAGVADAP